MHTSLTAAAVAGAAALAAAAPAVAAAPPTASLTGDQIVTAMAHDLARVGSYHMTARATDADGTLTFAGDVGHAGVRFTFGQGRSRISFLTVHGDAYLRANGAFWRTALEPGAAKKLAGRWVRVSAKLAAGLTTAYAPFEPRNLARCALGTHGTFTVQGTTKVRGRAAVLVAEAGDVPGAAPGTLAVTATGPVLPLRIVQTGPEAPGGAPDPACGEDASDAPDTTTKAVVTFSRFGTPLRLRRPAHAIDARKAAPAPRRGTTPA
jgi:hypothetical protein